MLSTLLALLRALPHLLQALAGHLLAYGELACAESLEALRVLRRRAIGLAIACFGGFMAMGLGCVWVIADTWDGPNRLWAVGGLFLGFLLVALIGTVIAFGGSRRAGTFQQLRAEWRADLQELARLNPSVAGNASASVMGAPGARR